MPNYKRLTPFKRCVLQNFPFIEADFDALTNYGLLCKIVEYLNNVISSQNEVQANVEALNNAFIELKSYVDNYFDNLDVQEEINNKLDEMAEDGTLYSLVFDSYVNANFELTRGFYAPRKTHYFLAKIKHEDETGNLVKIQHGFAGLENNIPVATKTPLEFSDENLTSLTINAGQFEVESESPIFNQIRGLVIHDGKVVVDNRQYMDEGLLRISWILGIKADNTLTFYTPYTTAEEILSDGVMETITGFTPVMVNGESYKSHLEYTNVWDTPYPKTMIGQNSNTKDVYFFVCNGHGTDDEEGMTNDEIISVMRLAGCDFIYQLDGGGSSEMVLKNEVLNLPSDSNYTEQRKVVDFLYIAGDTEDLNYQSNKEKLVNESIGELRNNVLSKHIFENGFIQLKNLNQGFQYPGIESFIDDVRSKLATYTDRLAYTTYTEGGNHVIFDVDADGLIKTMKGEHGYFPNQVPYLESGSNLNDYNYSTVLYCQSVSDGVVNAPYQSINATVFNIVTSTGRISQIAFPSSSTIGKNSVRTRIYTGGEWTEWIDFNRKTEWTALESDYSTNLAYRYCGNVIEIVGSLSNVTSNNTKICELPFTNGSKQRNFLLPGSGTGSSIAYTKAYIAPNDNKLICTQGTGTGSYNIDITIIE